MNEVYLHTRVANSPNFVLLHGDCCPPRRSQKVVGVTALVYRFVVLILNNSSEMIPHARKVSCQIMGQKIALDRDGGGKLDTPCKQT